jgi:hypothetical protein
MISKEVLYLLKGLKLRYLRERKFRKSVFVYFACIFSNLIVKVIQMEKKTSPIFINHQSTFFFFKEEPRVLSHYPHGHLSHLAAYKAPDCQFCISWFTGSL